MGGAQTFQVVMGPNEQPMVVSSMQQQPQMQYGQPNPPMQYGDAQNRSNMALQGSSAARVLNLRSRLGAGNALPAVQMSSFLQGKDEPDVDEESNPIPLTPYEQLLQDINLRYKKIAEIESDEAMKREQLMQGSCVCEALCLSDPTDPDPVCSLRRFSARLVTLLYVSCNDLSALQCLLTILSHLCRGICLISASSCLDLQLACLIVSIISMATFDWLEPVHLCESDLPFMYDPGRISFGILGFIHENEVMTNSYSHCSECSGIASKATGQSLCYWIARAVPCLSQLSLSLPPCSPRNIRSSFDPDRLVCVWFLTPVLSSWLRPA